MGYERKRGKLAALNALLRGGANGAPENSFAVVVGAIAVLADIKYVITLDTDTQLPRDSARQFVGTLAHPLNRARYDEGKRRVTEGYGILQPRVAASLPGTNRSRYAQLHGGEPGIDPYTRAVSDVYQDVFGEGSFIGKGIYDVDAFERSLKGRFPENRILSHDLLEGCYARAGLLSDVQLYEEYPAGYSQDVSRRYRWIRGDWQLVGWLRERVPALDGRRETNPLSGLSQWKIIDNLRRSVVPVALTAPAAAGLDGAVSTLVLDVVGARNHPDSVLECRDRGGAPQAEGCAAQSASGCGSTRNWPALRPGGLYAGDPPVRSVPQCACDCAHGGADAGHTQAPVGMESVRRQGYEQPYRPVRFRSVDVDRSGHCLRRRCLSRDVAAGRIGRGGADPVSLVCRSRHRLVDQPAADWTTGTAHTRRDAVSAEDVAQDLGILRNLRWPARPLAAAGQLSRGARRHASRIARHRPTWGWRCWRICLRTTSATSRPGN